MRKKKRKTILKNFDTQLHEGDLAMLRHLISAEMELPIDARNATLESLWKMFKDEMRTLKAVFRDVKADVLYFDRALKKLQRDLDDKLQELDREKEK